MKNILVWFRRDLRLCDHAALFSAIEMAKEKEEGLKKQVHLVFVFDSNILKELNNTQDHRFHFILEGLLELQKNLKKKGSNIHLLYGQPEEEILKLCYKLKITNFFYNRDYEPASVKRDQIVSSLLKKNGIAIHSFKDHVIFEKHEIMTKGKTLYKVFTPYKNEWIKNLTPEKFQSFKINERELKLFLAPQHHSYSLSSLLKLTGQKEKKPFKKGGRTMALKYLQNFRKKISHYNEDRNFPSKNGTSHLSPYIRQGMLSVREMLQLALEKEDQGHLSWRNEIIWRDFYQMILSGFPHVEKEAFKREYDQIKWPGSKNDFTCWCQGKTGVPIVDAAMRCLNQTGLMPNRLRMVVASYLCKILLINWRWGEKYFAAHLLDFDLAANNGGWQWCSSTGCDSQPYFRIFNPYQQSKKFDEDGKFIRQFCPELERFSKQDIHRPEHTSISQQKEAQCIIGQDYPLAIKCYETQRKLALALYQSVR